jgi:hypothetical protein
MYLAYILIYCLQDSEKLQPTPHSILTVRARVGGRGGGGGGGIWEGGRKIEGERKGKGRRKRGGEGEEKAAREQEGCCITSSYLLTLSVESIFPPSCHHNLPHPGLFPLLQILHILAVLSWSQPIYLLSRQKGLNPIVELNSEM